jgi:hypothetical protein
VRVPARCICCRLGHCAPLLHQNCGDPDVGHGCVGLGRRIGLLETCQHHAQVGLRLLNIGSPASSNSRRRSRAHGGITGIAPPPASGYGSRWFGSDAPPWNPLHRPAVGRLLKPLGRAAGWISGRWGRCGSGPSGTRCCPETWDPVLRVRRRAPSRSSSVAGSHGECVVPLVVDARYV